MSRSERTRTTLLAALGLVLGAIALWQPVGPITDSPGQRLVLYDNERGKGDHRHLGELEEAYAFTSIDRLLADFKSDVEALRGEPI